MEISTSLIAWYIDNKRDLPWRKTKNPYFIWLSEVMLQQTRVQQGMPYYFKFIEHYPSIEDMAAASEQEILYHWQGLGYYSRARNMHATAQYVANECNGIFPTEYKTILALRGIGEYTAAAIASFAYDLPHSVIDGNVHRAISRIFAIELPINKPSGHNEVKKAVLEIFDKKRPAIWNQAIMEFGSLQCTPKKPDCAACILSTKCQAYSAGMVKDLPYKEGKTKVKKVDHSYLVLRYKDKTYIEKRESGIWKNLHQFPLTERNLSESEAIITSNNLIKNKLNLIHQGTYTTTHLLSHRKINAKFHTIYLDRKPLFSKSNIFEIELDEVGTKFPVSVLIQKYINQLKRDDK